MQVKDLPQDLVFVVDSRGIEHTQSRFMEANEYDSFFVRTANGEYTQVWGMYGIVPEVNRRVYQIL